MRSPPGHVASTIAGRMLPIYEVATPDLAELQKGKGAVCRSSPSSNQPAVFGPLSDYSVAVTPPST